MTAVWRAAPRDLPWIIEVAERKYAAFDRDAALRWGASMIHNDDAAILRTEDAWCVAVCGERFYAPTKRLAHLLLLCAERTAPWQLVALGRAVCAWAKDRGCSRIDLEAETIGIDLGPLARRLGIARQTMNYVIEIGNGEA
jgi:hypothetical protein